VERKGAEAVAGPDEVQLVLTQWREMLDGVRDDLDAVADRMIGSPNFGFFAVSRTSLAGPGDARLRAIDLQYHDIRLERSSPSASDFARSMPITKFVKPFTILPRRPRLFPWQCVARYPNEIVAANWDSVVFDLGEGPLQRVPMLDP